MALTRARAAARAAVFATALLLFAGAAAGQEWPPKPTGFVTDAAGLLSPDEISRIERRLRVLEAHTGAQIALVTVPTTTPLAIEEYATSLFERWGVGTRGKDNGILVLVAAGERAVRIEVGYGLEGAVPDIIAHRLVRETVLPAFREGQYGAGLDAATAELTARVAKEYGASLPPDSVGLRGGGARSRGGGGGIAPGALLVMLLLFLIFGRRSLLPLLILGGGRHGGMWSSGGGHGRYGGGGFGGGFGGFGGGLSGGGGATGRW